MATLERSSRRKVKKEKKPRTRVEEICENDGEPIKAFKNDSKNEVSHIPVVSSAGASPSTTNASNISKKEEDCLKVISVTSGESLAASAAGHSLRESQVELHTDLTCSAMNQSGSSFGESSSSSVEKQVVDSKINDKSSANRMPEEIGIAKKSSLARESSSNDPKICSEPADIVKLQSALGSTSKSECPSNSCVMQSSSSDVLKLKKDSASDMQETCQNASLEVDASRNVISKLSMRERMITECASHEEEPTFDVIGEVQSVVVPTAPSAPPCDITVYEESFNRVNCLDESALCTLYPLVEIHVVFPTDPVIRAHPLHVLISDYLRACKHLERSVKRHDALVTEAEKLQEAVWSIKDEMVVKSGTCEDETLVTATYPTSVATKDETQLSLFAGSLSAAREALHSECAVHLFDSEAQRLRVEYFVQAEEEAQAVIPSPEELRVCMMILFSFVQKQDLNPNFISKVQSWLLRLGQVLLKLASPSDHLLLFSQLLRCPKGVSSWGLPLVQFDPPPPRSSSSSVKNCPELELVMAALSTLIESIQIPAASLQSDMHQNKELGDEAWVVLDSSGEEELLHLPSDYDLEIFLDRIPLKALVKHALGVLKEDDSTSLSGVDVLRLFALSNSAMKILGRGLQNYGTRRYPHFFKRIAALVIHLANLITDVLHIFKSSTYFEWDPAMKVRIMVEYEALIIRASGYLFQSVIHSTGWEMLSQLPYQDLTIHALWHLLAVFHRSGRVDCSGNVDIPSGGIEGWTAEIKESCCLFDESLSAESEEEASMLLTTIRNMALSSEDITFAEAVAFDIFRVGHQTCNSTELDLSNIADSLESSIFTKHPALFSIFIGWLNDSAQEVDQGILHLLSALPLHLWQPSKADMKILSSWVLSHDPASTWSIMSQTILLALPWRGVSPGDSPLPLDISRSAAALALEACLKWDSKGRIPSAMRQESGISTWAWSLVNILCIHPLDRKYCQAWQFDASAADENPLQEVIVRGLREAHPLASLISVLATDWGHNWIDAQKNAFPQLSNVVANGKNDAAISALYLIIPLFVDHIAELISCPPFQKLFLSLLFADRTYVKMAKSLIRYEFPGPILLQFGNMMVSLLEQSYRFDSSIGVSVAILLESILQIPNWKNEQEALYLLDLVLRSAFLEQSGKAWEEAVVLLGKVQELNMLHIQPPPGTLSTLMNLLARGPAPGSPRPLSLMTQSSFPNFPWFVLGALEVEEAHESLLWDQLQMELRASANIAGKSSLDSAIKNACESVGLLPFPAAYLCVYRWARQALDTPLGHPALLLFWAHFFSLYMRIFGTSSQISSMLFEGSSGSTLLNQLKKRLNESFEWYSKEASVDGVSHDTARWLKHCSRMFHSFSVLLEGGEQSALSNLSPEYSPARVAAGILHKNRTLWQKHFIDMAQSKSAISSSTQEWDSLRKNHREKMISLECDQLQPSSHPIQRIRDRLKSCSDPYPVPFPSFTKLSGRLEHVQIVCGKEATSKAITSCLSPILECSRQNSMYESEHTALDCAFIEQFPNLYQDVLVEFTQKVPCVPKVSPGTGQRVSCSSPAKIHFKVKESKMCREIWSDLEHNLSCRKRLISSVLKSAPLEACAAGIMLENMVRVLVSEKKSKSDASKIEGSALCALNLLLEVLSEEVVSHYLPAKKLVSSCIETLVHEFVLGNERNFILLLTQMLENRHLTGILSPLLNPSDLSTNGLLQAYGTLVMYLPDIDINLAFVLLSKFEINNLLHQRQPSKQERCAFVKLVIDGLMCCCSNSSESKWTLVLGLMQRHLKLLLAHNFPEILVDALELILRAAARQTHQPFIWNDVLESIIRFGYQNQSLSLADAINKAYTSSELWSQLIKEFSMAQTALSPIQVKDLMAVMAAFFRRERLHFGLHGLYPKYRMHWKPVQMLMELFGCSLLALRQRGNREVAEACDQSWMALRDMYAPWLLPYWEEELTGSECSLWILELMNGHPPLAPWIPSDTPFANSVAASFSSCLLFMFEITPGRHNFLGLIWDMYCSSFARPGVGCHILETIHGSLLPLPWSQFWPTVQNLKDMADMAESSPMECHFFLRAILPCVPWKEWMDSLVSSAPLSGQALSCFLKVLILISGTTSASKADGSGLLPLLEMANNLAWHNLNATDYTALLDLFISRANPMVVLSWNIPENDGEEDRALLQIFKTVAGFHEVSSPNLLHQRCLPFLHAIVKQLAKVIESGQYGISPIQSTADVALLGVIQELEKLINNGYASEEDQEKVSKMADAVKQVILPVLPNVSSKFIYSLSQAVAPKSMPQSNYQPTVLCAKGLIQALQSIRLPYMQLGLLIESAIETALLDTRNTCTSLDKVYNLLVNEGDRGLAIADGLSSAGYLLTLLAYLRTKSTGDNFNSEKMKSIRELLHHLVHRWLPAITISEDLEAKIPLLWSYSLVLVHKLDERSNGGSDAGSPSEDLSVLASSLSVLGDGHEGMVSSLLGAVGLKRKPSPSKRFRVMCLTFAAFLFACLEKSGLHESHLRESLAGVEKLCNRYKELRDVITIASSATSKSTNLSFTKGSELIAKLLGRLYPEKPGYLQCIS